MHSKIMGAALLVGIAAIGACTFPDVDYADAGDTTSAGSTGSGMLMNTTAPPNVTSGGGVCIPSECQINAGTCAGAAQKQHNACLATCKNNKPCHDGCDAAQAAALHACAVMCANCANATCGGGALDACNMYLGL
jgi:hypothetical protein